MNTIQQKNTWIKLSDPENMRRMSHSDKSKTK